MKYKKKPVVIDAIQWTGENPKECMKFVNSGAADVVGETIIIATLEGAMTASKNDWIIRGVKGEYYPCKPDIFEMTYESVDSKSSIAELFDALYEECKHGDDEHQQWLKSKIQDFVLRNNL